MLNRYFKARQPFDFHPHKYDIGVLIGLKPGYEDNLFIRKLMDLPESAYPLYYRYHLEYFLSKEPDGEQEFFTFVWQIVQRRIKFIEQKDPFHSSHARDVELIAILTRFQKYLRSIDRWHTEKTLPEIIAEQYEQIQRQAQQIAALKQELKEARKLETKEVIDIPKGYVLTFVDLCQKMRNIILPKEGKELVFSRTEIVWTKMISKYFTEGGNEINHDTIRRYFPADHKNPGDKYSGVPAKYQLFDIVPAKKRSI